MFDVFKCRQPVIAVHVDDKGKVWIYDGFGPQELKPVDSFEADGASDLCHAMRNMIAKHGDIEV